MATTGASFVLFTVTVNTSLAIAPARSVAVTRTSRLPTLAFNGVPLKVSVLASKASQEGRALPSASEAR